MFVNAVFSETRCAQYEFNLTMPANLQALLVYGMPLSIKLMIGG